MILLTLYAPLWFWYGAAFILGTIIGSFLNVYIYRFHTGKSLAGSSHCLSCGEPLRWFELFPVVSYLGLRGHCRTCKCVIPSRYFLVEVATGLLFALALTLTVDVVALLLWWWVLSLLVVITVYDIDHFIIPDRLVVYLLAAAIFLLGYQYWLVPVAITELLVHAGAVLAGAGFLLFLWVISKGRWLGFGDVKLAIPLGLLLSAADIFSFIVLSFWVGAIISVALLGWQRYKRGQAGLHLSRAALTMKSAVPFAPFMIIACLLVLLFDYNVLELFRF